MRKMYGKFLVLMLSSILCVISVFDGVSNAHSSHSSSSSTEQFAEMIATYHDHAVELTDEEFSQLQQVILEKWDQGEIETVEPKSKFDFDRARGTAFDGELENVKTYYVFIPFRESAGHFMPLSGITFAFANDGTIVQAHEVIIDEAENAFDIKIYSNGSLIGSHVVDGISGHSDGMVRPFGYWEDVAECLQNFGADGSIVATALAACSLVCPVTGPAGCAVCIGIYLAVDAGVIVGCLLQ